MSIFDNVRQLDLITVAEQYGLASRSGMVNCIFHDDRNPSMKLYSDHFYCFGCGAHGDVTDLTAKLYNLTPIEAANKIAADFGISTSEQMPNDIPVSEYLNKSQSYAADGYYITLMKAYIEWLIPQANFLPERLGSRFRHYREKARNNNLSGLGRTGDTVAWLMIGFDYLVSFLEYARTITSEQKNEMLSNAWEIFTKLALEQIDRSSEETPTQMFISAIHDLFETHRISTQLITGFPEHSSDKVGYHDDKYYYFIPSKIYAEVENYYLQQGENFPLRKARIMSQLRAEEITVCDKNASTLQKRFFRGKSKYLCFPKVIIDGVRDDDKTVA